MFVIITFTKYYAQYNNIAHSIAIAIVITFVCILYDPVAATSVDRIDRIAFSHRKFHQTDIAGGLWKRIIICSFVYYLSVCTP